MMPIVTVAALVEELRQGPLLQPAQADELVRDLRGRFTDPRALAKELLHRGWLTPFQVNQVFQGRSQALVLGPYVLLERLGEGGMGIVYKARHLRMERTVAVKVVRREKLANPDAVRRFHREIQAAAQLDHPNVVRALDADHAHGVHFYAMEYVEGFDLHRRLKESGPLPVREACEYVRQVALGLQHAHERGMVHRDIKPGNLFVTTRHGTARQPAATIVKILDMGLARLHEPEDPEASCLTQEGFVVGTIDYLAPEQALNSHTVDIRADLYSLGCTFYHLLIGQVPFPGGTQMERLFRHRDEEAVPVENLRPQVPAAVGAVVRKLMAKRPEDRYQRPAEVVNDLTSFLQGAQTAAPKTPTTDMATAGGRNRLPPIQMSNATEGTQEEDTWAALTADVKPPQPRAPRVKVPSLGRSKPVFALAAGGALLFVILVLLVFVIWTRSPSQEGVKTGGKELSADETPAVVMRGLLARADNPAADREELRRALLDFRLKYPGTPQSRVAAEQLVSLPSPLDRLEKSQLLIDRLPVGQAKDFLVHMLGRPRPRNEAPVWSVAFSPDCQTIATAGQERVIRLWDGAGGQERAVLRGHGGPVTAVAFSPDGSVLASASHDATVRLWDTATGQERFTLAGHESLVNGVAFSPSKHLVASASQDGTLRLWDVGSGAERGILNGHDGTVLCAAFSPDGKLLASGGLDRTVRLWDANHLERTALVILNHSAPVHTIAFAPDGRSLLFGGGGEGDLHAAEWTGKELKPGLLFGGRRQTVPAAVVGVDGRDLIAADRDGRLVFRKTATGEIWREWKLPWSCHGLALASDGRHLATANGNGTVCIFRLSPPTPHR